MSKEIGVVVTEPDEERTVFLNVLTGLPRTTSAKAFARVSSSATLPDKEKPSTDRPSQQPSRKGSIHKGVRGSHDHPLQFSEFRKKML